MPARRTRTRPQRKLFTVEMPDTLRRGLRFVKHRDGVSESEQVRRAVALWLEQKGVSLKGGKPRA